jgi:8-oxo-dGTP diphosphatase
MTEINFYKPEFNPDQSLTYSVIGARYMGKWIFVRHHDRSTWEIAAGHIEEGEKPGEAASRELAEETGAVDFNLRCIATYSVIKEGYVGYGRLYLADVLTLTNIADNPEIAEIILSDGLPDDLTYPDIQPALFRKCLESLDADKGDQQS